MSIPAPPPLNLPKQPPAVVISAVRGLTPAIVTGLGYALAKANVHLDDPTLALAVNTVMAAALGSLWTVVVRLLETRVAPWWGRLFIIPKAPAYSPGVGPQLAPVVVEPPANATNAPAVAVAATYVPQHLGLQPPTDGTAPTGGTP